MWVQRPFSGDVRYRSSGDRFAWKSSIPISAGVCMFQPGSVKSGGTWHVAHAAFPAKSIRPRPAEAALKLPFDGAGAGIASW